MIVGKKASQSFSLSFSEVGFRNIYFLRAERVERPDERLDLDAADLATGFAIG